MAEFERPQSNFRQSACRPRILPFLSPRHLSLQASSPSTTMAQSYIGCVATLVSDATSAEFALSHAESQLPSSRTPTCATAASSPGLTRQTRPSNCQMVRCHTLCRRRRCSPSLLSSVFYGHREPSVRLPILPTFLSTRMIPIRMYHFVSESA